MATSVAMYSSIIIIIVRTCSFIMNNLINYFAIENTANMNPK